MRTTLNWPEGARRLAIAASAFFFTASAVWVGSRFPENLRDAHAQLNRERMAKCMETVEIPPMPHPSKTAGDKYDFETLDYKISTSKFICERDMLQEAPDAPAARISAIKASIVELGILAGAYFVCALFLASLLWVARGFKPS